MGCNVVLIVPLLVVLAVGTFGCQDRAPTFRFPKSGVRLDFTNDGTEYKIAKGDTVLQTFKLDSTFTSAAFEKTSTGFKLTNEQGSSVNVDIVADSRDLTIFRVNRNMVNGEAQQDCLDLGIGRVNWFGGPETRHQYWPLEKHSFTSYSYVTKELDNFAIAERYFLNSEGIYIYVEETTPLFIDINAAGLEGMLCLSARKESPYSTAGDSFTFSYYVGTGRNSREAHLAAVERHLKKPTGIPDERMIRYPIWSTWALYKAAINQEIVQKFSDDILENQFKNSQLEIDDAWEVCYGALTFNENTFPNIADFTASLKANGFRVTLWVHPFINKGCDPWYSEAKDKGYLVLDSTGNPDTQWWNSETGEAAYVDFTKPEAADWFVERLKKLQTDAGIDSFKFDAGETSWSPNNPVLTGEQNLSPSLITIDYVRTVAKLGPIVEVRSGQGTQDLPIFLRMIDKDSNWGWNNGLLTLITTLLQMNLVGYPFVLPDMVGGNGYDDKPPNKELFIRWLQANVFMPSIQFSFVPWQFDAETVTISQAMVQLHDQWTDKIVERVNLVVSTGEPINPPLWWADPSDAVARQIYDQFMLGDDVIVAPVVREGEVDRDVYLPIGSWKDGNTGEVYEGPRWLMNYNAPLNVLPYFTRNS